MTGRCYITSQNHNYAITDSFDDKDTQITHINLNDNTVEGFVNKKHKVLSIQYHPEASPGPEDSNYIFENFVNML